LSTFHRSPNSCLASLSRRNRMWMAGGVFRPLILPRPSRHGLLPSHRRPQAEQAIFGKISSGLPHQPNRRNGLTLSRKHAEQRFAHNFKSAAAKRLEAHRRRRRLGLRCLTVRVNDRTVRHLISTGYLSLDSSGATPAVANALEAWIYDNIT